MTQGNSQVTAPLKRLDWENGATHARAASTPTKGCGNRSPTATPIIPPAITSRTPPTSTAGSGLPKAPRHSATALAAATRIRLAGTAPSTDSRWPAVRVPAVTGKLS